MTKKIEFICDRCEKVCKEEAVFTAPTRVNIYTNNNMCYKEFIGVKNYSHLCTTCMDNLVTLINDLLFKNDY